MAWQENPIRKRSFIKGSRHVTSLFAGPDSDGVTYPGDRKMCDPDTITIQLHHVEFINRTLELPPDAYALAINYPEKIATNYISTRGTTEDDDDDEE